MASHPNRFDYVAAQVSTGSLQQINWETDSVCYPLKVPSALTDELKREQERKKLVKKKAQRKVKKQKDKVKQSDRECRGELIRVHLSGRERSDQEIAS